MKLHNKMLVSIATFFVFVAASIRRAGEDRLRSQRKFRTI